MNVATLSSHVRRWQAHKLFPAAAFAGLGIALLAGAYAFEYIGGLKPCPLCYEQRVPWMFLIVIGGAVFAAERAGARREVAIGLYALAALIALYSAYLGLFHAGVEYKWWPGPPACADADAPLDSGDGLLGGLSPGEIVRCNEAAWTLAGISLAGFNFLFSLVAAALAFLGVRATLSERS